MCVRAQLCVVRLDELSVCGVHTLVCVCVCVFSRVCVECSRVDVCVRVCGRWGVGGLVARMCALVC